MGCNKFGVIFFSLMGRCAMGTKSLVDAIKAKCSFSHVGKWCKSDRIILHVFHFDFQFYNDPFGHYANIQTQWGKKVANTGTTFHFSINRCRWCNGANVWILIVFNTHWNLNLLYLPERLFCYVGRRLRHRCLSCPSMSARTGNMKSHQI